MRKDRDWRETLSLGSRSSLWPWRAWAAASTPGPAACRPRAGPRFSVGRGLYKLEADQATVVSSGLLPHPSLGAGAHLLLPAHPTLPRPRADRTGQVGR